MSSLLASLRKTRQPAPAKFLAANPGCWVQYFDDTPDRDASKALASRRFDPDTARRKQADACAVCFSLQAFGETRTKGGLLCFRNLGVDVDLVPADERGGITRAEIDHRKEEYLTNRLLPFPLKPHWLTETRHGFHAIFRVKPVRDGEAVRAAAGVNRKLVCALEGDPNAALLTQVLRVPGTFQFKDPSRPFLCRLLLDNAAAVGPHDLEAVSRLLDSLGVPDEGDRDGSGPAPSGAGNARSSAWQDRLAGVPEGQRNATAASVVGAIVARMPQEFWEVAGWGGLKEWNARNATPLPDRELRSVYESIARRESRKRRPPPRPREGFDTRGGVHVSLDVPVGGGSAGASRPGGIEMSPGQSRESDAGESGNPREVPPRKGC